MAAQIIYIDKTGANIITAKNFADAFAPVSGSSDQTAEKFYIENTGSRILNSLAIAIAAVGSSDGSGEVRIGADTGTVIKPYGVVPTLSAAGAGGIFASTGLKYYRITAYNGAGETVGSTEVSINVDVTTKKVTLTWTTVANASGYKIYRSTTSGSYVTPSLRATVVGQPSNTYTDDGDTLSAGALPSENTTGGSAPNYGTAPTLGVGPLSVGSLAIGQQYLFWLNRTISAGTPETGNPRLASIQVTES